MQQKYDAAFWSILCKHFSSKLMAIVSLNATCIHNFCTNTYIKPTLFFFVCLLFFTCLISCLIVLLLLFVT